MKKDGFLNEKLFVIPKDKSLDSRNTFITDIGYFPNAEFHYRKRTKGSDEHILILCIAGKGFVNDLTIHSETLTVIPKGCPHKYGSSEDSPWDIYWVHFDTKEGFPFDEITKIDLTKSQTKMYLDIFCNMIGFLVDEINDETLRFNSTALEYMISLLIHQNKASSKLPTIIKQTKEYVLEHLTEPISIQNLVDMFGYSKSHLNHIYKKTYDTPPIAYLTNIKMEIAANYLLITTMSIKQIALSLGYGDPYYFSRSFKQKYSISPKLYRQRNKTY